MKHFKYFLLAAWALALVTPVNAMHVANVGQDAKERPPIIPSRKPLNDFHVSGYLDVSYNYLAQSNRFTSGVYDRDNDLTENGFTLQQLAATFQLQPEQGFGFVLNPILGKDALQISPDGIDANVFHAADMGFTVGQAYGLYNIDHLTFKVGEMLTLAGLEQYYYTRDTNFSRSILDGTAQPGIHVGIRAIHNPNPHWKLILGVNNGWATVKSPLNQNHIEAGLGYASDPTFNIMLNLQSGQEPIVNGASRGLMGVRNLLDMYATWQVMPHLQLATNADYAVQSKAVKADGSVGAVVWSGIALYANNQWSEHWRSSVRTEVFADADGFMTGIAQTWREITLTVAYRLFKSLEISAEARHDFSNKASFADKHGAGARKQQQSFALEALYSVS